MVNASDIALSLRLKALENTLALVTAVIIIQGLILFKPSASTFASCTENVPMYVGQNEVAIHANVG